MAYELFKKQAEFGKQGEKMVKERLEQQGCFVIDISNDTRFNLKQDCDFVVWAKKVENYICHVEVKTDRRINQTRNMFIETYSDFENGEKGWFYTSITDWLFYGDATKEIFYCFILSSLKEYINNSVNVREASVYDYFAGGQFCKIRKGYLVNIDNFATWCKQNKKVFCEL